MKKYAVKLRNHAMLAKVFSHPCLFLIIAIPKYNSMKRLFSTKYSDNSLSFALLLLRITLGGLIIPYGYMKMTHFAQWSSGFTDPFHVGSTASYILVIFAEFFCGIFVVLGLMTRFATIPLIITMAVVVFYVNHGHFTGDKQEIVPTLFLAGFIALLFTGPGKISMDRLIGK